MTAAPIMPEPSSKPASPPSVGLGVMPDFVRRHIGPSDADMEKDAQVFGIDPLFVRNVSDAI